MTSHRETYQHLIGSHVDEVVAKVKADGLEPRTYSFMGYIQSHNPNMVQIQFDPETQKVQGISG